jgi:hypothetical protein
VVQKNVVVFLQAFLYILKKTEKWKKGVLCSRCQKLCSPFWYPSSHKQMYGKR